MTSNLKRLDDFGPAQPETIAPRLEGLPADTVRGDAHGESAHVLTR